MSSTIQEVEERIDGLLEDIALGDAGLSTWLSKHRSGLSLLPPDTVGTVVVMAFALERLAVSEAGRLVAAHLATMDGPDRRRLVEQVLAARKAADADALAPAPPPDIDDPTPWVARWLETVAPYAHEEARWVWLEQGGQPGAAQRYRYTDPMLGPIVLVYTVSVRSGLPYRHLSATFTMDSPGPDGVVIDERWLASAREGLLLWLNLLTSKVWPLHEAVNATVALGRAVPRQGGGMRVQVVAHAFVRHDLDPISAAASATVNALEGRRDTRASGLVDAKGNPLSSS